MKSILHFRSLMLAFLVMAYSADARDLRVFVLVDDGGKDRSARDAVTTHVTSVLRRIPGTLIVAQDNYPDYEFQVLLVPLQLQNGTPNGWAWTGMLLSHINILYQLSLITNVTEEQNSAIFKITEANAFYLAHWCGYAPTRSQLLRSMNEVIVNFNGSYLENGRVFCATLKGGESDPSPTPTPSTSGLRMVPTPEPKRTAETNGSPILEGERYPQTRLHILSADEVKGLTTAQLRYAINEMYARYGATFPNTPDVQKQFAKFSWYEPNPSLTFEDIDSMMTDVERENIKLLALYREGKRNP